MSSLPIAKVLVVDDVEENLLAMRGLLGPREGVELLLARSGREALELLLLHEVAVALLDVQMPEMDGFELAELMRGTEATRRVPIIFVTAGSRETSHVFRGYEVGAVDFLFKPIDPVLLGHKVNTFVELYRQRAEQVRLTEELQSLLRLNETFVAAIGHDLRSPLSAIVMGAQLIGRAPLEPGLKHKAERIRANAQRMVGILDQLYDLARVRLGGGISVNPKAADFKQIAGQVIEELRDVHPERQVTMDYVGDTAGTWDVDRLGQVLANLLGNALRYGTAEMPVTLRVRGTPRTLAVEVHNGGVIAPELLPHLFDPFRRGAAPARENLGLGLFIARQILVAHGAAIEVCSTAEQGTTFRFELPRTPPA